MVAGLERRAKLRAPLARGFQLAAHACGPLSSSVFLSAAGAGPLGPEQKQVALHLALGYEVFTLPRAWGDALAALAWLQPYHSSGCCFKK
jgi:hypothetical protein